MYAGDILLLAQSVSSLQNLLCICENELLNLDMCLNVMESMCTRIGPRYKLKCSNLVTNNGREILRVDTVAWVFSLCRPAGFAALLITQRNFIEPLTLCLAKYVELRHKMFSSNCLCPNAFLSSLQKSVQPLELDGSFMKIFYTRSKEIGNYCMEMFNVQTPLYYNLVWYCRV